LLPTIAAMVPAPQKGDSPRRICSSASRPKPPANGCEPCRVPVSILNRSGNWLLAVIALFADAES
jgi:hypothetical protein